MRPERDSCPGTHAGRAHAWRPPCSRSPGRARPRPDLQIRHGSPRSLVRLTIKSEFSRFSPTSPGRSNHLKTVSIVKELVMTLATRSPRAHAPPAAPAASRLGRWPGRNRRRSRRQPGVGACVPDSEPARRMEPGDRNAWPLPRLRAAVRGLVRRGSPRPASDGAGALAHRAGVCRPPANAGYYLLLVVGIRAAGALLTDMVIGVIPVAVTVSLQRCSTPAFRWRRLALPLTLVMLGLALVEALEISGVHAVPGRSGGRGCWRG